MQPKIVEYVLSFLAVLVILTVHEYSHGYAAYRLGDNTAKNFGRLSLNPLKHIDPRNDMPRGIRIWLGTPGTGQPSQP